MIVVKYSSALSVLLVPWFFMLHLLPSWWFPPSSFQPDDLPSFLIWFLFLCFFWCLAVLLSWFIEQIVGDYWLKKWFNTVPPDALEVLHLPSWLNEWLMMMMLMMMVMMDSFHWDLLKMKAHPSLIYPTNEICWWTLLNSFVSTCTYSFWSSSWY